MIGPLFFLSGFASLVFEIATMKLFSQVLGDAVLASTLTISGYMLGLAAGSHWIGRRADGLARPLQVYGLMECAIAATGFLVPLAVFVLEHELPGRGSPTGHLLLEALVALVSLLIPTFLMGGTLPVLVRELLRRRQRVDRSISFLYALNAFGAALGAMAAGFAVLPALGIAATHRLALGLYLVVGLAALGLERLAPSAAPSPSQPPGEEPGEGAPSALTPRRAAGILGATGFVLMSLEHVWFRYFIMVFDSSTYSFSVILAGVILGIGGGAWLANLVERRRPPSLGGLRAGLAVYILWLLASIPLYDEVPRFFLEYQARFGLGWWPLIGLKFATGMTLMLVPALCSGFLFPVGLGLASAERGREARHIGAITAANTLGTVLGIVVATFWLVPWLGLQGTMELAAMVLLAVFASLGGADRLAALVVAAALLALATHGPWKWRQIGSAGYRSVRPGSAYTVDDFWNTVTEEKADLLMVRHGRLATVSVERRGPTLSLRINGKVEASNHMDMLTQQLSGHLPMLLHPDPRKVLVIGLGSGVTGGATRAHHPELLALCEIEPAVVEAAEFFAAENREVLRAPATRLHLEDAKSLLRRNPETYDVIISEPTNPWVSGLASLFTVEYFARVRGRLSPGGVYLQWFHLYECNPRVLSIVLRTIQSVFEGASVWVMGPTDIAILAGRDGPVAPDLARMARGMAIPEVGEDLAGMGLTHPESLLGLNLLDPEALRGWGEADAPRNTEDRLVLEYEAPLAFASGASVELGEASTGTLYDVALAGGVPLEARREVGIYFAELPTRHLQRIEGELLAVLEADPTDDEIREVLGQHLAREGLLEASLAHLLRAAPRRPSALLLSFEVLILALEEGGRGSEAGAASSALALYVQAAGRGELEADVHWAAGHLARLMGREALWRAAVEAAGARAGRDPETRERLEAAWDELAQRADQLYLEAIQLEVGGFRERAGATYRRAAAADPDNPAIREALERLGGGGG